MRGRRKAKDLFAAMLCATCLAGAGQAVAAEYPVFRYKGVVLGGAGQPGASDPGPPATEDPDGTAGPTDPTDTDGPRVVAVPGGTTVTPGYEPDGGGFSIVHKPIADTFFGTSWPIASYCVTASGADGNYDLNFADWAVSDQPWFRGADIVQPGQRDREIQGENPRGQPVPAVYPYGNSGVYYPGNLFESNGVTWRTTSHDVCVRIHVDLDALPPGEDVVTPEMTITGNSWADAAVEKDGEIVYDPENYSYVKWSWEHGASATAEHRFRLRISR